MVWAEVSPAAVLGIEDQAPILNRQPIHADDQNCSDVLPTHSLFGPIPVGMPPYTALLT
jgi:hypothetical protein